MSGLKQISGFVVGCILLGTVVFGQNPTPPLIIVQAANAPAAATPKPTTVQESSGIQGAIKSMQDLKAANQELLKKQDEMLERLDEMQKAADQLKIFAHRTGG